ncbi:GNAT family N-acetyltransferase [Nocardioides marmoraquaticus]
MAALHLTDDPAEALALATPLLRRDPLRSSVVATTLRRDVRRREAGEPAPAGRPYWFAIVHEGDDPVGMVMRAAERPPHPLFVLATPERDLRALAQLLHARGEDVGAVNGVEPLAHHLAEEYAALAGRRVAVAMRTRLHRLGRLRPPAGVPGGLRPVRPDEVDLAAAWLDDFHRDVEVQAGREPRAGSPTDPREVLLRVREDRLWWWEDGEPVHVLGANPPAEGVARIAPVHTPAPLRGRGYAGAAVAALAERLAAQGAEVCLFTDQANPVSNRLYERLGFEPVTDMVDLLLDSRGHD